MVLTVDGMGRGSEGLLAPAARGERAAGGNERTGGDTGSGSARQPGGSRRYHRRYQATLGAVAGLLTAAVALGVGQLVSGLSARQGSPAVAVGQAAIDLAPPPLKNFAISVFGANDKMALVIGILVVLAIFAALIGVAAMRRLAYGYAAW